MGSGCSYCFGGLFFFFVGNVQNLTTIVVRLKNTAAVVSTNNTNKTTRLSDPRSNRIAESVHCFISFLFFPYPSVSVLSPTAFGP